MNSRIALVARRMLVGQVVLVSGNLPGQSFLLPPLLALKVRVGNPRGLRNSLMTMWLDDL